MFFGSHAKTLKNIEKHLKNIEKTLKVIALTAVSNCNTLALRLRTLTVEILDRCPKKVTRDPPGTLTKIKIPRSEHFGNAIWPMSPDNPRAEHTKASGRPSVTADTFVFCVSGILEICQVCPKV